MRVLAREGDTVTLEASKSELIGLVNLINHAMNAGFEIEEHDCSSLIGLEWDEVNRLRDEIRTAAKGD